MTKVNKITTCLTKLPIPFQMTCKEAYDRFIDKSTGKSKILSWEEIQRKVNWSEQLKTQFRISILSYTAVNPIIIAHIDSCIKSCKINGFLEHVEKMELLKTQYGAEYISLEGQNRTYSIIKDIKNKVGIDDYVQNWAIYEEGSLDDWFTIYRQHAKGAPPNSQEKRNGFYTELSRYVRETTKKYKSIFDGISIKFKSDRLKDDEFIANSIGYMTYSTFGEHAGKSLSVNIDEMYERGDIPYSSKYNKVFKMLSEFSNKISESGYKKLKNGVAYYLISFFNYMEDNRYKIQDKDVFYTQLYTWLSIQQNSKNLLSKYTFSDSLRHKTNDKYLNDVILLGEEWLNKLDETIITKGSDRGEHDRIEIWNNLTEKVLRINGCIIDKNGNEVWFDENNKTEYRETTLQEILNTKEVEVEDIIPASRNKNASDISNKEFATRNYNRWKSDRIAKYS